MFEKFVTAPPSHQNAVDIFKGHWASQLDTIAPGLVAGYAPHFAPEELTSHAVRTLGRYGRLDGMSVLELGPLDGGRTYKLEAFGADVLAIEANVEAFLKCLIVKEIARMKSRFLLGNFVPYMRDATERFDIVFASGVLYHLTDPISTIESIARITDKVFVWSAVYDCTRPQAPPVKPKSDDRFPDKTFYVLEYGDRESPTFWGGVEAQSVWMCKEDMFEIFRAVGFKNFMPLELPPNDSHGIACFSATK